MENHIDFMQAALAEADKCLPVTTAFSVGCVLVARLPDTAPTTIATGYSRELPGNTHAEGNALTKARSLSPENLSQLLHNQPGIPLESVLSFTDVYTTLEPCSIRLSGLRPCVDLLIAANVKRCIIGVGEPPDFVSCEGAQQLKDAGIEVLWFDGLQDECLSIARRVAHES